jgi:hypothetical protein
MKAYIKKDFLIETIGNEKVLVGNGEQINFSRLVMLNDTAAFIVTELQKQTEPVTAEQLTESLVESYDVGYDEALTDVKELLDQLQKQDIVNIE